MTKHGHCSIRLLLLVVLITGLVPRYARADEGSHDKPFRLYATAAFGPIGVVYSSGAMTINNRLAQGQQAIWDGDLIETLAGASANVTLDVTGQVTLASGAAVRLATKPTAVDEDNVGHVLVASLVKGDMVVRLKQEARAYIEAGGSAYTTSWGASFRIEVREGGAIIHEANGSVRIEPRIDSPTFKARAVRTRLPIIEIQNAPVRTKVNQRSRPLAHQWRKYYRRTISQMVAYRPDALLVSNQTTQPQQIEEPVANRVVFLRVEPPDIGQIVNAADQVIDSALTDSNGVVTFFFRAGGNRAEGDVVATLAPDPGDPPGTQIEEYRRRVIIWKSGIWTPRNILLMSAAATVVIIVCCGPKERGPLEQNPPPIFNP